MIDDLRETLRNVTSFVPDFDAEAGYSLEGFVWFQGWNDLVFKQGEKVDEYAFNLRNLIRDVRHDLDAPDLPFVIGGAGHKGLNATGT